MLIKDVLDSVQSLGKLKKERNEEARVQLEVLEKFEKNTKMVQSVTGLQDSELIAGKEEQWREAGNQIKEDINTLLNRKPFDLEQQKVFEKLVNAANLYASSKRAYADQKFRTEGNTVLQNSPLVGRIDDSLREVDEYGKKAREIIEKLRKKYK